MAREEQVINHTPSAPKNAKKQTLDCLPSEIAIPIFEYLDIKSSASFRLVNRQFATLGAGVKFRELKFLRNTDITIPQYLFKHARSIEFGKDICPFRIAWILHDCSKTLKYVKLYLGDHLIVLKALLDCGTLEKADLIILGSAKSWEQLFTELSSQDVQKKLKSLRTLSVDFRSAEEGVGFKQLSGLFPNLVKINVHGGSCDSEYLPITIQNVKIRSTKMESTLDVDRLCLTKLVVKDSFRNLKLPNNPIPTLLDIKWCSTDAFDDNRLMSFENWLSAFPRSRYLIISNPLAQFRMDNVSSTYMDLLELTVKSGPAIWEFLNSFPNLTSLQLLYRNGLGTTYSEVPFGNLSKLKRLEVSSGTLESVDALVWLRQSIFNSFYSTGQRNLDFTFLQNQEHTPKWGSFLRFIGLVAEVSKSITLKLRRNCALDPEWLEVVLANSNLKTLSITFHATPAGAISKAEQWKKFGLKLRENGMEIQVVLN